MDVRASSARARRGSSSTRSSIAPSAGRRRQSGGRTCSASPSAACSGCARTDLELIEIAPGIDLQRDIPARRMDFCTGDEGPARADGRAHLHRRADGLAPRPASTFRSGVGWSYDAQQDRVLLSTSRAVGAHAGHRRDLRRGAAALAPLGRKVDAVVNYDRFDRAGAEDDYVEMVKGDGCPLPHRDPLHRQRLPAQKLGGELESGASRALLRECERSLARAGNP